MSTHTVDHESQIIVPTVVESPEKRSQRLSIGVLLTLLGAILVALAFTVSKSGLIALSDAFAAVVTTVCTNPDAASTPMWAFMPKYHWLPFLA